MVTMVPQLFKHFRGQVFLTLFYIRLPSNVTVFSDIYLNQAHVLKARINAVDHRYLHKVSKYFIQ